MADPITSNHLSHKYYIKNETKFKEILYIFIYYRQEIMNLPSQTTPSMFYLHNKNSRFCIILQYRR